MPSGVEFDEDNISFGRPAARPGMPPSMAGYGQPANAGGRGISGFLIRHGFVKSNGGAQVVMIGIVVVNFIIMFVLIHFFL